MPLCRTPPPAQLRTHPPEGTENWAVAFPKKTFQQSFDSAVLRAAGQKKIFQGWKTSAGWLDPLFPRGWSLKGPALGTPCCRTLRFLAPREKQS